MQLVPLHLGYEQQKAEIKSVDSIHSQAGSVVVMVTGVLGRVDAAPVDVAANPKRHFVQTFVLVGLYTS
jgi:hypothetical protein